MDHTVNGADLLADAPHEFVRSKSMLGVLWHLPQNAGIAFLKFYRIVVSPLYGDVCRYFPSCSAYALEAVTVHGAFKGLGLSMSRLLRCHPWAAGGIDRVPEGGRHFDSVCETPKIILLNHPHLARHAACDRPGDDDLVTQGATVR